MLKKSNKSNTQFLFFINLFFTFLFTTFLLFSNNCFADESQSETYEYYEPVYMHPSIEELNEFEMRNSLMVGTRTVIEPQPQGQKSLLDFMPYLGNERHQLGCGNCWVWSNTGALEIQLAAFRGIPDRLSIQYFNSNFSKDYKINACNGGFTSYFSTFYNAKKKLIPWDNENAYYQDGNGGKTCTDNETNKTYSCSNVEPELISEEPHYNLETISVENIKLFNDTTQNINNKIKYYINNNMPLVLDYCFPNTNNFTAFWNSKSENEIYDLTDFDEDDTPSQISCHSTLIIGYNDTSNNEDEHYLEILNSWGTPSRRPHGTFRLKMNMDYQKRVTTTDGSTYSLIQGIHLTNAYFEQKEGTGTAIIEVVDTNGKPIKDHLLSITFNDNTTFVTGNDGKVIIPNLENGSEYKIQLNANSGYNNKEYDNGELVKCCQYDNLEVSGTFDFSESNVVNFTFTKECEDFDSANQTYSATLIFKKNDNWAYGEDVTINFNGEIYNKTGYTYQYKIPNIHNGDHYTISFSKDGHIFIPSVIERTMDARPSCNPTGYSYYITMYETTNNNVSINVIDENNAPVENETVIFNNTTYKTDANGVINLPNYLKTGDTYDIKIKDERGSVTTNEGFTCYNYNNEARFSGTFDFTENNTKTFTFVRHYNTLANNPPFLISVTDIDIGGSIPNVTLNINGVTYQTNEAGKIFIDNISYGNTYNISYSKRGYISGSEELVIENEIDDESMLNSKYCSSVYYKNYHTIRMYKTKENEETPQNPGSITIEVKDTNNTPIENELVKFNDYYFRTDENGLINITSLKTGQKYNIQMIYKRGLAKGFAETTCYNYDNKYKFTGTFDFSENTNKTFTFVKHYIDPKEKGSLIIYTHEKFTNDSLSDVTINFNENTFETNNDSFLVIENIPFNTHYLITAAKDGYFNETREGNFVRPEYADDEYVCTNQLNSIFLDLINQATGIPPTNTYTPTVTNTFTNTYTKTNTFTPSNTFTNTSTYTDTPTVTNTYTNSSTFTDTPTVINTFTNTYTKTKTPTHSFQGRIVINVKDILGSGIKDVDVILNNKDVYKTDMYGIAYIFYNVGEEFDINFRREGYLFTPDSYHGELQHKDEAIYINVTMYADDKYNGCNEVKIDLKELKQNVKKINNFASIMKNNDTKIANDYYLKINKLLKQIPQKAMICNEKSKFKTKSFVKTKKNLKNYITNLYKKALSINKDYKKATKKKASWLKNRKTKLNVFSNIAKKNVNKIPNRIYIVK